MSTFARWKSWESYAAVVEPDFMTEAQFKRIQRAGGYLLHTMATQKMATLPGSMYMVHATVRDWVKAEGAVLRSGDRSDTRYARASSTVALACDSVEEAVALAGDGDRLLRLLSGVRQLNVVLKDRCHHEAPGIAESLLVLAAESNKDYFDTHARACGQLAEQLQLWQLPELVRTYFHESFDCLMLGHDQLGALAACRGLERASKIVAAQFSLQLVQRPTAQAPQPAPRALEGCDWFEVVEALGRATWADGQLVIDKVGSAQVHFVRNMRNVAGHASTSSVVEWRQTAILAAAAAHRLLERAKEPGQTITPTVITK